MWLDQTKRHLAETRGILHVPLALSLVAITLLGLGSWGVMRHWRKLTETQLRLDRCVGGIAMELQETLEGIDDDNDRITAIRAALLAANLLPPSIPPLRASLAAVVLHQEYLRGKWKLNQALWLVRRGCGEFKDQAGPLPELSLLRDPPDFLGPRGLRWVPAPPESGFRIDVRFAPRASSAKVLKKARWVAEWAGLP